MREFINLINEESSKAEIEQLLKSNGFEDLKISGNKIAVLVQIPGSAKKNQYRMQMMQSILGILQQNNLDAAYSNDTGLSSLGGVVFQSSPVKIVVKDSGVQGDKSAGVGNEIELAAMMQSVIEKYGTANITFVDARGVSLNIQNATAVETTGKDVRSRKKADVVISSADRRLPVSIKELSAEAWESADSSFGERAREIISRLSEQGIVELEKLDKTKNGRPIYKLSKEIVIEPTEQEALDAIFGTDINPEGGIVIQTFEPKHFVQENNNVKIECHAIITNINDIPESHLMVWVLRNDSTRNSRILGIQGIRVMAATLERGLGAKGTKKPILVDQDGNVKDRSFEPNDRDGKEVTTKQLKKFDPEKTRVQIKPKGRTAELRDKDTTPRQKRD
jgi:hypothetical protein